MEIVTITEARRRLDGALPSYEAKIEYVTPNQALGRITARDITAACDYPPYRKSPFDGYALCSHEKKGYDVIATIGAGFSIRPSFLISMISPPVRSELRTVRRMSSRRPRAFGW